MWLTTIQMPSLLKIPFYVKVACISICLLAFTFTLYKGQQIIVPLIYATLIAILLNPLVNWLIRKKMNKTLAITVAVLLASLAIVLIMLVISTQISMLSDAFPGLMEKIDNKGQALSGWLAKTFKTQPERINQWVTNTKQKAIDGFEIGATLSGVGRVFMLGFLLPVYVFMILYYKPLFLEFIRKLFRLEHHAAVVEILTKSKSIIQNYLVGLFFEMLIMAVLNSAGLLILGIDYAIILGITGALLNIIPYIGGVIAIALPMTIAFVTKDSLLYPGLVLVIYIFTQFIDNHYISPRIVASRVKINALISIIAVLIGGALWGVPGMFLSIPLIAIIKVICDHIEPLKPWGFLLGNIVPTKSTFSFVKPLKK
jgi:predicted PurR-regulated permease PerM